jgi:1,4-alpha-glucan branching enzyme
MHTRDKTDHKTLFRVCCPGEREVLLVLRAQRNATTQTLPMRPCGGGWWQQAVDLAPGEYRARYYAGDDDARTVYLGPAPAIERPVGQSFQTSGLDAVIAVGPDRARRWASHPAESGRDGSITQFATHLAS